MGLGRLASAVSLASSMADKGKSRRGLEPDDVIHDGTSPEL